MAVNMGKCAVCGAPATWSVQGKGCCSDTACIDAAMCKGLEPVKQVRDLLAGAADATTLVYEANNGHWPGGE